MEKALSILTQQLRNGIPEHLPGPEEGQLIMQMRPPTHIMLQAAREIENLINIINNQNNTIAYLERNNLQDTDEIIKLRNQICQLESTLNSMESSQAGTQPTPSSETPSNGSSTTSEQDTSSQSSA